MRGAVRLCSPLTATGRGLNCCERSWVGSSVRRFWRQRSRTPRRSPVTRPFDLNKLAVVYLRQSTPGQVRENVTATEEQYRLREIPEAAGFTSDHILVEDRDLGLSGATIAGRKGMLHV